MQVEYTHDPDMRKTAVAITLILALLFSAAVGGLFVDVGKANFMNSLPKLPPPIYIRSDGSVDPSSAGIQRVGDTYAFTGNILNSIEVQRDDIEIDGNGFSLTQTPVNISGLGTPAGWYPGIRLIDRRNVTIKNVTIQDCVSGISIENSANITLTNNSVTGIGRIAIFSASSSNITISQNEITNSDQGIVIIDSKRMNIFENNIKRNRIGINAYSYDDANHYVVIIRNNITGNADAGITVVGIYSFQVIIVGNNIADNRVGVHVSFLANFAVHHNNFVSTAKNVESSSCQGPWDDGAEGNYWSDYNGTDLNGDGVGDTPYIVETPRIWIEPTTQTPVTFGVNAQDNYPLMHPVNISSVTIELPEWLAPPPQSRSLPTSSRSSRSPVVSILSPENRSYSAIYDSYVAVPLIFKTNALLSWVGYSLDGGSNITALENGTRIEIPKDSRNLTLYANDTAGNWAVPQTVYYEIAFNMGLVQEPFPIMPVAAASVAAFVLVGAGLLVYFRKRKQQGEQPKKLYPFPFFLFNLH